MRAAFSSVIIHHFAIKSSFFMSLGACRLKKRIFALVAGLCAGLTLISCSSSSTKGPPSGLTERVMASQGVTSVATFGGIFVINGQNDTLPRSSEISAGTNPGLMAISPTRNILVVFDPISNGVYALNTQRESGLGRVQLPGPTTSIVVPTAAQVGYAAVPTATVSGFSFLGAVEVMNLAGSLTTTIAVTNAQTVILVLMHVVAAVVIVRLLTLSDRSAAR